MGFGRVDDAMVVVDATVVVAMVRDCGRDETSSEYVVSQRVCVVSQRADVGRGTWMRSDRLRRAASFESEEVTLPESDVKNASRLVSRPDDDPYLVRTRPYDLLRCLHDDVRERM